MSYKFIFSLLGSIVLFAAQLALVEALPFGGYLCLSLVVLVFIVVLFDMETAIFWFLTNGFLLDLFSFKLFGFHTVLMLVILSVVYFLLNNILTNRSLYAYLLLVAGTILLYDLAGYIVFGLPWNNFFILEVKKIGANFLLTTLIFYSIGVLSTRLRPVFLIRSRN